MSAPADRKEAWRPVIGALATALLLAPDLNCLVLSAKTEPSVFVQFCRNGRWIRAEAAGNRFLPAGRQFDGEQAVAMTDGLHFTRPDPAGCENWWRELELTEDTEAYAVMLSGAVMTLYHPSLHDIASPADVHYRAWGRGSPVLRHDLGVDPEPRFA